jgi:hypothetical protein
VLRKFGIDLTVELHFFFTGFPEDAYGSEWLFLPGELSFDPESGFSETDVSRV